MNRLGSASMGEASSPSTLRLSGPRLGSSRGSCTRRGGAGRGKSIHRRDSGAGRCCPAWRSSLGTATPAPPPTTSSSTTSKRHGSPAIMRFDFAVSRKNASVMIWERACWWTAILIRDSNTPDGVLHWPPVYLWTTDGSRAPARRPRPGSSGWSGGSPCTS